MAVAPTVQNSTQTDDDAASPTASPTTKVLAYLRTKGIPPSSANVRAALEANARDPGVIPGLRSDTAATEADDQAAMKAAGPSVGRRGNVSTQIESVESPQGGTPDKSPDRTTTPDTSKTTSAQPDSGLSPDYYLGATGNESPGIGGLVSMILGGGGLGAGAYGASRAMSTFGNAPPGAPVPTPVSPTEIPLPQDTIDYTGLGSRAGPMPDPGAGLAPPPPTAMAEPPPSPMELAMRQAVPSTGVPQPSIPPGPSSPVLPADLGAPPPQTIPSGPNTQVRPANMPENAPRLPMPNRVNAPPTPADFYHPSWRTFTGPLGRAILGHM